MARIVAIPNYKGEVSPCFEYTATITIYTISNREIVDKKNFGLQSRDPLDRLRLLRDQEVDVLICGGLQDVFENLVKANNIEVISWVSGTVETLLDSYINSQLKPHHKLPKKCKVNKANSSSND